MLLKVLLLMPAAFVPAGDEANTDCGHSRVHAEAMERFRTSSPEPLRPVDTPESVGDSRRLRFSVERVVVDRMRVQRWYLTAGGAGELETGLEEPRTAGAEHRQMVAHGVSRGTRVQTAHQPQRGDRRGMLQ